MNTAPTHTALVEDVAQRLTTWWESPDAYKASFGDADRHALYLLGLDPDLVTGHTDWERSHDARYEDWTGGYSDGVERHISQLIGWLLATSIVHWTATFRLVN